MLGDVRSASRPNGRANRSAERLATSRPCAVGYPRPAGGGSIAGMDRLRMTEAWLTAAALLSLGARDLAPDLVDETLGVVLKYEEDIRQVRGDGTRRYLAEAGAAG